MNEYLVSWTENGVWTQGYYSGSSKDDATNAAHAEHPNGVNFYAQPTVRNECIDYGEDGE